MDKYINVLCRQNPEMKLKCGNPECGKEFKVKSKNVFQNKEYKHMCPFCQKSTTYNTTEFVEDFKRQMKKLGITLM